MLWELISILNMLKLLVGCLIYTANQSSNANVKNNNPMYVVDAKIGEKPTGKNIIFV